jgi:hypothetical protein
MNIVQLFPSGLSQALQETAKPDAGVAVSDTVAPPAKAPEQVVPQSMPPPLTVLAAAPAPDFSTASVLHRGADGVHGTTTGLNPAVTCLLPFIVMLQERPFGASQPPQLKTPQPAGTVAMSVTTVPAANVEEHVAPQLMPPPATIPASEQNPDFSTVKVKDWSGAVNVAVTLRSWVIGTVHCAPLEDGQFVHPVKPHPASGVAVNTVETCPANVSVQSGPEAAQSIPLPVTRPEPDTLTVNL